jgi:gamma-glutamylcyclotransferase (GGCT)/AIG2-like uncharacterized protein YtfP
VGIAMQYYFAYGSNMNFEQMKKRCSNARFLKRAYLEGYKFVYDGYSNSRNSAVANVVEEKSEIVWGGLFEVTNDDIKNLDTYEGYPNNYDRVVLEIKDGKGNNYKAMVYLRGPREVGKPSDEYRKIVLEGTKNCELPNEYIDRFIMA